MYKYRKNTSYFVWIQNLTHPEVYSFGTGYKLRLVYKVIHAFL